MYITSLVIPVPAQNVEVYREWAQMSAGFFKEYGCLEIVEAWEDFIPEGKTTDFRKAVAARPGEKIVLIWQIWSDKRTFEAAEEKMHHDPRMDRDPPFDAKRLILGCFTPILTMGRG